MLCSVGWSPPCLAGLHDVKYDTLFESHGRSYLPAYDWHWLKAQAYQESRYDPAAVSPVGAMGLMQIMPTTGRELAAATGVVGPLTSPAISVLYGAFYMRRMVGIWHSPRTDEERLELALASYNAGAGNVIRAQRLANGHPLWVVISPRLQDITGRHATETLRYVASIFQWHCALLAG